MTAQKRRLPSPRLTASPSAGIKGRTSLLTQARAAREAIDAHDPDRIVALGGDCLIDLAPIAYLNETYDGELGVLWVDAHPDVQRPEHSSHAHAHVLGMLLDEGDPDFTAKVETPIDPNRVMYAGLNDWSETEDEIISRLGLQHVPATDVADDSKLVLDWIEEQEITRRSSQSKKTRTGKQMMLQVRRMEFYKPPVCLYVRYWLALRIRWSDSQKTVIVLNHLTN